MENKILAMLALLMVFLLASCTSNSKNSMMGNQMMDGGSASPGTAQISSFSRAIAGLDEAQESQIIEIKDGETYSLEAKPVVKEINGNKIRMYGYNGQIPGPLLKIKQGSTFYVDFKNSLEFETTIHWHGLRHDFRFDGVEGISQKAVKPGENFVYKVAAPDAGMFWYHPHIREDLAQEMGLYGNLWVEPSDENYFNKVGKEVPLFLDDLRLSGSDVDFNPKLATSTFMGRFGNIMLLNGETSYNLDANQGEIVRFYLTDSANARPFNFTIEGHKLKLIGSDLGNFEKESFVDSIIINPGERYIVEVLFDKEGLFKIQHKMPSKIHYLGEISVKKSDAKNDGTFSSTKEDIQAKSGIDEYRKHFDAKPDYEFVLTLNQNVMRGMMRENSEEIEWEDSGHMAMMNQMSDAHNVKWIIRDKATGKENMDITYKVKKGDVKKLRIVNDPNSMHPMQHPMHLHGQRFLVLSLDGKKNDNLAWKDTAMIPGGKTVDLLVDFSNPGEWMLHCHISEHLEAGMMAVFSVV